MPASFMVAATAPTLRSVDALARLAAEPDRAALLLDVDGVLAPIVARPEDAATPDATRAELRRLAGRYALVACITGRASDVAREIVGCSRAALRRRARPRARAVGRRVGRAGPPLRTRNGLAGGRGEAALRSRSITGAPTTRPRRGARSRRSLRGRRTKVCGRASEGWCSICCRPWKRLRAPPCGGCSTRRVSTARSTPATTRPISTDSPRSTTSSFRSASRSFRRGATRPAGAADLVVDSPEAFAALLGTL